MDKEGLKEQPKQSQAFNVTQLTQACCDNYNFNHANRHHLYATTNN